jgi:hypothetical protein
VQPATRAFKKISSGLIGIAFGVIALIAVSTWWLSHRGVSQARAHDSTAHRYADQLLGLQIALASNGQHFEPSLNSLRQNAVKLRGAGVWPSLPDGVTVLERPASQTFCVAVRHARGEHWYVIYDDVGTAKEMPDSKEPADCP